MIATNAKLAERPEKDAGNAGQAAISQRQFGPAKPGVSQTLVQRNTAQAKTSSNHGEFGPTRIGGPSA